MSIHEVRVPDIGSDFADVIEILVKPGQLLSENDPVVVLESAKASMEIPSPAAGRVRDIVVTLGQQTSQGDLLITLEQVAEEAVTSPVAVVAAPIPATPAGPVPGAPAASAGAETDAEIDVLVPDIGSDAADVIEILVKPGDQVALDQPVVVLESAKASMEVPSSAAGVVVALSVSVGDSVQQGAVLLRLRVQHGVAAQPAAKAVDAPDVVQASVPQVATVSPAALPAVTRSPEQPQVSSGPVHAGPAVRRLARELGVDLAGVKGTGPHARILKEDVHAHVHQHLRAPVPVAAPQVGGGGLPPLPEIDFARFGPVQLRPLTRIQKLSAQNLHRAWVHIPHVTQFDEADITALEAFRVTHKDTFKAQGIGLTLLAFLVRAVAHALRQMPRFNTSLSRDGESLVWKDYVHIGVAVDTPNGLVVPVIRDADTKSVTAIARELGELSARARDKKLMPADMQGATFSISSLGGIGGTAFTPIVNWPEVAILGVSRSAQKPVWNGQQFEPRLLLPLSLSYDHRVIDGADAARFTTLLTRLLGDLRLLLL